MDELSLLKGQVDLIRKETEVNTKALGMEFERIGKAFSQMGNLMDLLYLEVSVLIEMLADLKVINTEAFQAKLEEVAKKVEESLKAAAEKKEGQEDPKIEKL
jgi:hypothetical protein